ncbi:uncharacterized protein UTRI_00359_B [Ustilago trichophora]|uniref:Uncharacterized protein n=1 Tax=Ustilago trichophora TaxID=86804 RepID=A0A5C3DSJ6_9BASI|nr:uncharacterized protein UTRI_00359_B [Ustilago trichophora]
MTEISSRPNTSTPSSAEDEALRLSLTYLSLSATIHRQPPPELPHGSDQDSPASSSSSSPSSPSSWVDLLPVSISDIDRPAIHRTSTGNSSSTRKKNGVRAGLANLSNPPSPFGCQLGTPIATPTPRIPAPYQHRHQYDYFTMRPTPHELSVENDNLPQADPEEVMG